jgi:hypothetical protein
VFPTALKLWPAYDSILPPRLLNQQTNLKERRE